MPVKVPSSRLGAFASSILCLVALTGISTSVVQANVTSLSGTLTSSYGSGGPGANSFATSTIQIQSTNFSLTGNFVCDAVFGLSEGYAPTETANPNAVLSESSPLFGNCIPPLHLNSMQLVYQGQTYTSLKLSLTFSGNKANAPTSFLSYPAGLYVASISGIAFTMTGDVVVYPAGSDQSGPTGSPLFSIPISGSGTFQASMQGQLFAGFQGVSTYQFEPSPTAFSTDTTTQGAWSGNYGGDGYLIASGPSYLPPYASVSVTQASTYTWAQMTTDPRALQNGPQAKSGIASAFVGNSNVNINFTDNYPHRVSLYLLDFDTTTRSETLTVTDADTGAVLDQQVISKFHNGVYANFDLSGNVVIHITGASGASAVLSGIFFGPSNSLTAPPPPVTSSAFFYSSDATTQGTWSPKYGSNGYMIANGPSSTLTHGTLTVQGAQTYTWTPSTADARALRTSPSANTGIASAYTQYASTPFSFNLYNTQQQLVSLYLLDWDNSGRSETITISDLSTGTVLSTQSVSNFQAGVYVSFMVTGNVVIKVQPNPGTTPAVSGIFLN